METRQPGQARAAQDRRLQPEERALGRVALRSGCFGSVDGAAESAAVHVGAADERRIRRLRLY